MSELLVCNPLGELENVTDSDYPFLEDIRAQQARIIPTKTTSYVYEKVTVHINQENYSNDSYSKIYKNKHILSKLSPFACKLLIYIGYTLEYKAIRIQMSPQDCNMNKTTFYKAVEELMEHQIIKKIENKKGWYWVNVTVLVVGNIYK